MNARNHSSTAGRENEPPAGLRHGIPCQLLIEAINLRLRAANIAKRSRDTYAKTSDFERKSLPLTCSRDHLTGAGECAGGIAEVDRFAVRDRRCR
ncbi:MAG TPA: hypothetical protein VFX76_22315 [Roseiflexaceae bacterium]|nr:hypothetical protein [Roseiflexaceae bacterium]